VRQEHAVDRPGREERGSVLLEFAIVAPLLVLLLYGIVAFGFVMAVKHSVTQAAADGARAAVPVAQTGTAPTQAALAQADNAIHWLGQCNAGGITCTTTVAQCPNEPQGWNCLTMNVSYDYRDHPVIPSLPGLGLVLPSTIPASTTTLLAGSSPQVSQ